MEDIAARRAAEALLAEHNANTHFRTLVPPEGPAKTTTIGAAVGAGKVPAIAAALNGRLINGLITDEATARAILER